MSFDCLVSGANHPWVTSILKLVKVVQIHASLSYLPPLDQIVDCVIPVLKGKKAKENFALVVKAIDERIERNSNRPDFMKFILEKNYKQGMTRDEIDSNLRGVILAGSESSAATLTASTWFLLNNRDAMGKLTKEIRTAFSDYKDISVASVSSLPYLHAVLQEAMRLHAPIPASRPRLVDRTSFEISGRPVPMGTRVSVPHKAAYKSALNFKDPFSFAPERWLPGTVTYRDDNRDAFQPFSLGSRNCIGQKLAWAEIKLTLCKVLWSFDLELTANNKSDWTDQKVYHVHQKAPLHVRLTRTDLAVPEDVPMKLQ